MRISLIFPLIILAVRKLDWKACVALASKRFATALQHPWLVTCGRTSYSLYLWHVVVLLGVYHLLGDTLPQPVLVLLILVGSALATAASYALLEKPSITWGQAAAAALTKARARARPS
jgi:peptidoglycan/LPS O-acetylase OafA/YrhL